MSASYELDYTRAVRRQILWDKTRTKAASLLALGYDKQYVANEVEVSRGTIYNWLDDPEFAAEVDRLSVMLDVSSRAERLRIAMRIVRQRTDEDGNLHSEKDLLDWLKFAQSETDGAKIDLSKLAEMLAGESAQQADGPATRQLAGTIDTTATSTSTSGSESGDSSLLSQDVVGPDEELNPS
jgi:hypothetical protein